MKAPEWLHDVIAAPFRKPWVWLSKPVQKPIRRDQEQQVMGVEATKKRIEAEIMKRQMDGLHNHRNQIDMMNMPEFADAIDTTKIKSAIEAEAASSGGAIRG
jgi:glutamate racemase